VLLEDGDPVEGAWDPVRMGQVVANLLANSVVYGDAAEPVRVSLSRKGDEVVLAMRNPGAPYVQEPMDLLFDPFRRSREDGSRPRGLGLGLYVAKQVIAAHGGAIDAESSHECGGTVFTVRMPWMRSVPDPG
jgi:signal transduction histidine kinase